MKNKGFTLVELLVVIVIIGILAAAAISVFGGGTDKAKLNTVKNDVAAMHSSGTLAIADQGWDATRGIVSLVNQGYLSAQPQNPYHIAGGTTSFYGYAASKVVSGQTTNPVIYTAGYADDSANGNRFEKGGTASFGIGSGVLGASDWIGNPAGGTAESWLAVS